MSLTTAIIMIVFLCCLFCATVDRVTNKALRYSYIVTASIVALGILTHIKL